MVFSFAGCASGPQEIITSTDHYDIIVSQMSLGPNEYFENEEDVYRPRNENERFVWMSFALTPKVDSEIYYSAMKLTAGDVISSPFRVLSVQGANEKPVSAREALKAGNTIMRKAIFIMPADKLPATLTLPGKQPIPVPEGVVSNYGG